MRGKLFSPAPNEVTIGITPAHAGKTGICPNICRYVKDHPRACGENPQAPWKISFSPGSPPRMRGKRFLLQRCRCVAGITPAHAGKTLCKQIRDTTGRDHPRACGENKAFLLCPLEKEGSPPRMRGKLEHREILLGKARITPAYAGKTSSPG